jgi:hypothetical protein
MGVLVSSMLSYLEKNPKEQVSFAQLENELSHLSRREQVSSAVAIGAVIFGILSLGAVILGGPFLMGALFAIALIAAAYAYCCRLAETALRDKVGPQKGQIELPVAQQAIAHQAAATSS